MIHKSKFLKIFLPTIILLPVIVAVLGYYFALPHFINLEKYETLIQAMVKEKIAYPVKLGKLDLKLTWNLRAKISADKFVINKLDKSKFINIGSSFIEISLPALLNKRVALKKISINTLNADITRLENGKFDIESILTKTKNLKYKVLLQNAEILVNGYSVNFTENFIKPTQNYLLTGEEIRISKFTPDKFIEAAIRGKIVVKSKSNTNFDIIFSSKLPVTGNANTYIKGEITNFKPDKLIPYINKTFSTKIVSIAGKGNINFDIELCDKDLSKNKFYINWLVNGVRIKTIEHGLFSEHNGKLKLLSKGYFNKNILSFDILKIKGKNVNIDTSGQIKNYRNGRDKISLNLKLILNKSGLQPLAKLFPKTIKFKRPYFENILKHRVKAFAAGRVDIKRKGDATQMFGFMNYEKLEMLGGFKNTPKGFGKVNFIGSTISFKNKFFLDKDKFVNINGSGKPFKSKDINIDITSSEVDFAKVQKVLFVLKDFFKMKLKEVFKMDFNGNGRANFNISGKTYDIKMNGYLEGSGLTIKHEGFSKSAQNVSGKLRFFSKKLYYDELSGVVEGMKVFPTGYTSLITPKMKHGYVDMVIHIPKLELEKGLDLVRTSPRLIKSKTALKEILRSSGTADTKIHIEGPRNDIKADGQLVLDDAAVLCKGFGGWFESLKGPLKFEEENIFLEEISGKIKDSNIKITGFINENLDAQLKITSESLNFKSTRDFLMGSYMLEEIRKALGDYTEINGVGSVSVILKGNLNENPFQSLVFKNLKVIFNHKLTGVPILLNNGELKITSDKINVNNVTGISEGINFNIDGNISNLKAYISDDKPLISDFNLKIKKFDLSKIKKISKIPLLPGKVKVFLANFKDFQGYAQAYMDCKPESYTIKIIPDNISAVYTPYDSLVFIKSGEAEISDKNIKISSIKGVLSESTFNITGFINDYKEKPEFDLAANINLNFNDIKKLRYYSTIPLYAEGIIPFFLTMKGTSEDWKVFGNIIMEKGNYLNYITNLGLPKDKVRLLTFDASGNKDRLDIDRLQIDASNLEKPQNYDESNNSAGFKNLINIHGTIDKLKSSKPIFRNFIIKTNNENLIATKIFNPFMGHMLDNGCCNFFSSGAFKINIELNGTVASPEIYGNTTFLDIAIPDYDTYIKSISLNFDKNAINMDISGLNTGESRLNINALATTKPEAPLLVKNLKIDSQRLNLDEILKIFSKETVGKLGNLPPFVITKGILKVDKLIMKNLMTANMNALFNFTPDWRLTVSKINFLAANGQGNGNIYYNLFDNELSASFKVEQMQANTLATTLLMLPNEVYGTLNGNFQFLTRGKNRQELIANSNGSAEFEVYNGHFVRLGSLEYFLRAVNIIQSGIGGFNINNVIDLLAPKKTGHFEKLKGRVFVRDGILYTDDIISSGKNLSLYMAGKMDMLTNRADIQILGKLPKKITGLLGPVGSLSINEFIDYMPGLGFLPATPGKKGIIDLIPGLNKIPGLELSNSQKYRRFAVQIKGDLYKQESVKSFRWIE